MKTWIKKSLALILSLAMVLSLGLTVATASQNLAGDADGNGSVDSADASAILRHIVKLTDIPTARLKYADVDNNGSVDSADASNILRWVVKLDKGFNANKIVVRLIATSDVHGAFYNTDYTSGVSGTASSSMLNVATYVKEVRAAYDNVILLDLGDSIQGTPLTAYFALKKSEVEDPAMKTYRMMGYDLFVLGNHEFNYGLEVLDRQLDYLTSDSTEKESKVEVLAANYLAKKRAFDTEADAWRGLAPYKVFEYEDAIGNTYNVGVIGLANPNIEQWETPANYDGISICELTETYEAYKEELEDNCDFIIAAVHSGVESAGDMDKLGENQVRHLVTSTEGIDLVLSGHAHSTGVQYINNKAGEKVPVLSLGTKASSVGDVTLTIDTQQGTLTPEYKNTSVTGKAQDAELKAAMQPYETAVWEEYLNTKIGTASAAFPKGAFDAEPTALMDLVNLAQLWAVEKETLPNEYPLISIAGPVTSTVSGANMINAGDITMTDMFKLYKYENWLYCIEMKGSEVKLWLDKAATNLNNSWYFDTLYGLNYKLVTYKPAGERVEDLTYPNGDPVGDDDIFYVAVNNYRYAGGCDYTTYSLDLEWKTLEQRTVYYSGTDFGANEDEGQVRNIIAEYIKELETISPTCANNWSVDSDDPDADPDKVRTIAEVKAKLAVAPGGLYTVEGIVTYISDTNVYIEEDIGGVREAICCYFPSNMPTNISVGDRIQVKGSTMYYQNMPELSNCALVGDPVAATPLTPTVLTIAQILDLGHDIDCRLVKTEGILGSVNTGGTTPLNDPVDPSVTMNIYKIPTLTGIGEGSRIFVTGVMAPYYDAFQFRVMSADYIVLAQ